jgi:hypothetical protein
MDPKFILTDDDTNDSTDSSISTTSTNNSKKMIDGEKTWTAITPKNNTHYYLCNKVVSNKEVQSGIRQLFIFISIKIVIKLLQ